MYRVCEGMVWERRSHAFQLKNSTGYYNYSKRCIFVSDDWETCACALWKVCSILCTILSKRLSETSGRATQQEHWLSASSLIYTGHTCTWRYSSLVSLRGVVWRGRRWTTYTHFLVWNYSFYVRFIYMYMYVCDLGFTYLLRRPAVHPLLLLGLHLWHSASPPCLT